MSIKGRFERFTRQIRPTDEHIKEANRQTDYMVDQLRNKVSEDKKFTLEKVLKAGSNAKFTSLRKTDENLFDVDLGAYYSGEGATKEQLDKLLRFTRDQLWGIYPTKKREDFELLKSAVRVEFVSGINLWVDVAPIIRDTSLNIENGGWIPRADGWRLTSVTCHNQFVTSRTTRTKNTPGPVRFNRLVRMVKWWNNLQGELTQPSIFCDCIAAAAYEEIGVTNEWQSSLVGVFRFMLKHQFESPIVFDDYYDPSKIELPDDPIIVMDSVNPGNNITGSWTEATRDKYLDRVQDAYESMKYARSYELDGDEDEAVSEWCRVFGEKFRSLSNPSE